VNKLASLPFVKLEYEMWGHHTTKIPKSTEAWVKPGLDVRIPCLCPSSGANTTQPGVSAQDFGCFLKGLLADTTGKRSQIKDDWTSRFLCQDR